MMFDRLSRASAILSHHVSTTCGGREVSAMDFTSGNSLSPAPAPRPCDHRCSGEALGWAWRNRSCPRRSNGS
eukprot:406021-Hanusia_phi.AAC.1